MKDIESVAANLYDGGWRSEDKEQLIDEYSLTKEEATEICDFLHDMEMDSILDIEDGYIPSSYYGDYSPSNPWDAPGMSVKDFI